jgi:predicted nucleic acid-binding protein
MTLIADASVIVDFYLADERADAIAARIGDHVLQAPVTIDAEMLHALRRQLFAGVPIGRIERALELFRMTPIVRHPIQPLVSRMWSLRHNITAYDAAYVALAESLDVPLLTRDLRLARSSGHAARIEHID